MKNKRILLSIATFFVLTASMAQTQSLGELTNLASIKKELRNKRISSVDKYGNNGDWISNIKQGETHEIQIKGTGIISHIWMTIAPNQLNRNNLILRMYWDGSENPSVEAPLAAFFGNGWDEKYEYTSLPLAVGPGNGTSLVSYFTMPFEKGARIEIENQGEVVLEKLFYYVDYLEMDKLPENMGRFHAWYNHETTEALPEGETEWGIVGQQQNNTDGKNNYIFADIEGEGHFIGINYYVQCPSPMWYGEGDDMIFIDGEKMPSLLGTGTEDFFNTSWCPKSIFSHPYYGFARVNWDIGWMGRTHAYRFFISDPIYFTKSFKGTIEHGHDNNMTLDIGTVAYWYQSKAGKLPPPPSFEARQPKKLIEGMDIHRWRHEWRKNNGNDSKLWGNEDKK